MENNGTFYFHLEYISAILYILGPLGNLMVSWYAFPLFGILYQEKSGNPGSVGKMHFGIAKLRESCNADLVRKARAWVGMYITTGYL
jgi:hypothetical protein